MDMGKRLYSISNGDIVKLFYDIADILEMQGVDFKPVAYRKAAQSIEALQKPLSEYYEQNKLRTISGIGEHLAAKIKELLETGKLQSYEKLKKQLPSGITKLMNIPGVGPKKVKRLYQILKIKSVSDLKKALKSHKIQKLKGFGAKSEQDIAAGLNMRSISERKPYSVVMPEAMALKRILEQLPQTEKIAIAGSLRRKKSTIGDIDMLVQSSNPEAVMERFTKNERVKTVLAKGKTKSMIITKSGIQADLRVIPANSWGAALHYFTGPKAHNIELRKLAIKKGYKMNEYGIFDRKTGRQIAGKTEEDVYRILGLKYIKPENREKY
jgi:DNA polymerase (family 10)